MFVFKGICSTDRGIVIEENELPPLSFSKRSTNKVKIEGRNGSLREIGDFEDVEKTVHCYLLGDRYDLDEVTDWLFGEGDLILGNDERYYYKAFIEDIEIKLIIEDEAYELNIKFVLEPFRYLTLGKIEKQVTNGMIQNNLGNYEAEPIYRIKGKGNITVTVNNESFQIIGLNGEITIVTEIQDVLNKQGNKMRGRFVTLKTGQNKISWSGNVTEFYITPNWRRR